MWLLLLLAEPPPCAARPPTNEEGVMRHHHFFFLKKQGVIFSWWCGGGGGGGDRQPATGVDKKGVWFLFEQSVHLPSADDDAARPKGKPSCRWPAGHEIGTPSLLPRSSRHLSAVESSRGTGRSRSGQRGKEKELWELRLSFVHLSAPTAISHASTFSKYL